MEEGLTVRRQTDELTGLNSISIIDPKDRPVLVKICASGVLGRCKRQGLMLSGRCPAHYFLEANAILGLEDGDAVADR